MVGTGLHRARVEPGRSIRRYDRRRPNGRAAFRVCLRHLL